MTASIEVAVIGAGQAGLAIAFGLMRDHVDPRAREEMRQEQSKKDRHYVEACRRAKGFNQY